MLVDSLHSQENYKQINLLPLKMDFVNGWAMIQTLGEGAYGEVKLLVNKTEGSAVAMKVINLEEHPEAKENVMKEINIHRRLSDPHIIKCFGYRHEIEKSIYYIFLEYAPGGELFDKIEPDVGMEAWEAQKFMKQLISGVDYLHTNGIAHRDLKPENLLLDEHDNLKISDFGLATFFRLRGKTRPLDTKCGTMQYMAPEIHSSKKYRAEPVDIWASGIVLVAMLAGELPWDKAEATCLEYVEWRSDSCQWMARSPWCKLDNLVLSLVRRILNPQPSQRLNITKIRDHRWLTKRHSQTKGPQTMLRSPSPALKRLRTDDISPPSNLDPRMCQSQPEIVVNTGPLDNKEPAQFSFSQPAQIDDLLVSTQYLATQSNTSQDSMQKLVRRMTRFFVSVDPDKALQKLQEVIQGLGLTSRISTPGIMTITTIDKHKNHLAFKASALDMDKQTLLDFRLSKGCGIEFKRRFLILRKHLSNIVNKGPVSWPIAMATNNVP